VPLPDLATPDLAPEIVEPDLPVEETVEPEVVTVDTVIPPGPACGDIFKCGISKGCGDLDPACWESCAGEAEPEALAAFADLATCVEDQCSQLPEEQQGDCLMSLCLEEVFACVGGEGDADCRATLKCIQTCPEDDGVCFFDCIAASNEESLALILDMANATQMEGFALMVECIGGKGDFSCGQAVSCFTNCEGTEPGGPGEDPTVDCMMDCIEETSPEGADDLLAFLGCVEEKCPEGMEECPGVFLCMDKCPGLGF
jgi:hypothetical protein